MHRPVVTIGQTPAFVASMMMLLLVGNKRAAVSMSQAVSSYNGGETWESYWLFSLCCFCLVAEAGDILAGEDSVRMRALVVQDKVVQHLRRKMP